MMRTFWAGLALAAALIAPAAAQADTAYATTNLNLRAGPGTQYPVATTLGAGAPVEVYGCLQDYSWCDVSYADTRGWVAAQYLQEGGQVLLPSYARVVAVPTVTYSVDDYWYSHYRDRPFYRQRDYYRTWTPGPVFPGPGPYVGGGYRGDFGGGGWQRDRAHRADQFRFDGNRGDQAGHGRGDNNDRLARRDRRERQREIDTESYTTPNQLCRRGVCYNR